MASPTLTRAEVRKLSRYIRTAGYTLPRIGVSVDVPPAAREDFRSDAGNVPVRVAHDARGYYFTGWERGTPAAPYFDRFDICEAYACLEMDYNVGGWLRERLSNQRRREACSVQLERMHFRARPDLCTHNLTENGFAIYAAAVERLKLPR